MAGKKEGEIDDFIDWSLNDEEASSPASQAGPVIMKKICMLGDPAVGKTSLVTRFVDSMFDDKYMQTIGAKVTKRTMAIEEISTRHRFRLKLIIWDIAGQTSYDFIKPTYYRDAEGAIIVADCTRKETLANAPHWCQSIRDVCGQIPVVLLVNKSDLSVDAELTAEEAMAVAVRLNAPFFMTSARSGENVESAFSDLARRLMRETLNTEPA